MNKRLIFIKGKDTIQINQKLPLDIRKATVYDYGVFYNCHLQTDTLYAIELKKIDLNDIPPEYNNYYRINTIYTGKAPNSKYTEITKNTKFAFRGNYTKYFDLENEIYEMISLSPVTGCVLHH